MLHTSPSCNHLSRGGGGCHVRRDGRLLSRLPRPAHSVCVLRDEVHKRISDLALVDRQVGSSAKPLRKHVHLSSLSIRDDVKL
jgi:hypothetical protein